MTAQEYLQYLLDIVYGSYKINTIYASLNVYANARYRQTDNDCFMKHYDDPTLNAYESISAWRADIFYNDYVMPFIKVLPNEISEKLAKVVFGVLPIRIPNGFSAKAPAGDYLVAIDDGLPMMISHYNEMMLHSGTFGIIDGIRFKLEHYRSIVEYFENKGMLVIPPIDNKLQESSLWLSIAESITQELFVIAHEYAHVFLGHLDQEHMHNTGSVKCSSKFYSENESDDNVCISCSKYNYKQRQELEADITAIEWLFHMFETRPLAINILELIPKNTARLSVLGLFLFLRIIDVNIDKSEGDSHPDAHERLTHIVCHVWPLLTDEERKYAQGIIKICSTTPTIDKLNGTLKMMSIFSKAKGSENGETISDALGDLKFKKSNKAVISLELDQESELDLNGVLEIDPDNLIVAKSKKFDSIFPTMTLVGTVSKTTCQLIKNIVVQRVTSQRHLELKINAKMVTINHVDEIDQIIERVVI